MHARTQHFQRPRGYLLADTMVALVLLALVIGIMAKMQSDGRLTRQQFAQQRQAIRHAQQALTQLQRGQWPSDAAADDAPSPWRHTVHVERLSPQPPGDWGQLIWVRVEATVNGRLASLEGAVSAEHAAAIDLAEAGEADHD